MNDAYPRSGVAFVLAAFALSTGGCDLRYDASPMAQRQSAFASVPARGDGQEVGTDEAVEDSELTAQVREAILADPQLQSQNVYVVTEDSAVALGHRRFAGASRARGGARRLYPWCGASAGQAGSAVLIRKAARPPPGVTCERAATSRS